MFLLKGGYMNKLKEYVKEFYHIATKPEIRILPGNLAFFLMLSLVPLITLVGILCSKFSISILEFTSIFENFLPTAVVEFLHPFFNGTTSGTHIVLFLILGFIVASNGAHAIILASNALYKIDDANYIVRRIKAFFLTIILMLLFVFALVVLAFGNIIVSFILELQIFSSIASSVYEIFVWFKWPIAFVLIFIMIKALYTMAPDMKISSKYVNLGSLFTTVGWILSTAIYSFYANNLANYDRFYGNISNIAILMIWLYLISYIFVIGIAINTSYYKIDDKKE